MAYQEGRFSSPERESRPARRLTQDNLNQLGELDSIERRKLQLFQQALIRDVQAFRHRKMRREESLQSVFKQSKPNALAKSGGGYVDR